MFTATKTVTINADFLQEIKDDDVHYDVLLKENFDQCTKLTAAAIKPRKFASLLESIEFEPGVACVLAAS